MKKDDILDFLDKKFAKVAKKSDAKKDKKKRKNTAEHAKPSETQTKKVSKDVKGGLVEALMNEQEENERAGVPITTTTIYSELVPAGSAVAVDNAGVKALKQFHLKTPELYD